MGKRPTVAIAYDFDGTLAPGNMQEHEFLPDVGLTPNEFWSEVKRVAYQQQADEVLVYMNLMLQKARASGVSVRRADFKRRGKSVRLFPGVATWFGRINGYAAKRGVNVQHFLISSGNEEIVSGTRVAKEFDAIYASKYMFDANGAAEWPALAINYTTKTQFLFRINKGVKDITDNSSVNRYVGKSKRPVPFEHMVFIGDGATDIPCFRLVKEQGGLSIAVYPRRTRGGRARALQYKHDGRVHAIAPADYSRGGQLDRLVLTHIDAVQARHAHALQRGS